MGLTLAAGRTRVAVASLRSQSCHAVVPDKDASDSDPNAVRLSPFASGAILWKFTRRGAFEYACLIPGHLEAGMRGEVIVK